MGLLDTLIKKQEVKKGHEVCIPDHAKLHFSSVKKSPEVQQEGAFIVEGIYEIGKEITITGEVFSGSIRPTSKLVLGSLKIPLKEVLIHGKSTEKISAGTKGAITICPADYVRISSGELLEFR